ncbi:hypothetical protein BHE74_00003219 [Ensete ventricosum]|nr:hypothetical protein BHE74_00003219 [Ensete ventricosum]
MAAASASLTSSCSLSPIRLSSPPPRPLRESLRVWNRETLDISRPRRGVRCSSSSNNRIPSPGSGEPSEPPTWFVLGQEEVIVRAKKAKERAALEVMTETGVVSKPSSSPSDNSTTASPNPDPKTEDPLREMLKD